MTCHSDQRKSLDVNFMSDVAHLLPRCPRCGYGLRLVRGYWWCDLCRVPLAPGKGVSIREVFRQAGQSLKRHFARTRSRRAAMVYPSLASSQRGRDLARCPACGSLTPRELSSCVHCRTSFGRPLEVPQPRPIVSPESPNRDDAVYQYIVENEGEISLSKASTDLSMTMPQLQASIRRLEDSGRIMRDSLREQGSP